MRAARAWAVVCGVVAALLELAVAELLAVVMGATASPLIAVGSLVIDLAPAPLKDATIALFGTGDKVALLVVLGLLVLAASAMAGLVEYRKRGSGLAILVLASGLAVLAVATRSGSSWVQMLPTLLGMLVGAWFLLTAIARLRRWQTGPVHGAAGPDRRSFLLFALITGAASVAVGIGARTLTAGAAAVSAIRDSLALPPAASQAPPVPAGAELGVPGVTPYLTSNDTFYRIDTALQVPRIDPAEWSLRIHGDVNEEIVLSFDDLLALPLEEHLITLACVSNEVGGDLIGNALWLGYPLRHLLERAQPRSGADMVLSTSSDGFTAGTPLSALIDPARAALLAIGMNGEPLPIAHGFPVRMVVPGLYGYVSATKWVVALEVTRFDRAEGYWTPRGWSALGPVKTQSRIDVPAAGARKPAGRVAIAGMAWAQHTGIERVEVRVDGGDWQDATIGQASGPDTWVQWVLPVDLLAGDHTATVRATDRSGYTQTERTAAPAPDGATGWHRRTFTVT